MSVLGFVELDAKVVVDARTLLYRCCGGGWNPRGQGVYEGRVISIDEDSFLLQCDNGLGKLAEVIVDFDQVISVQSPRSERRLVT